MSETAPQPGAIPVAPGTTSAPGTMSAPGAAPAPEASGLRIEMVRLMRLRGDEERELPSRIVAQVQARDGEQSVVSFGDVALRTAAERDRAAGARWDVTEQLIAHLPGRELAADAGGADRLLAPIVERVGSSTRESLSAQASADRRRGALEWSTRRLARVAINVLRRRPMREHPERNPLTLPGTNALRLALQGAISQVRTGESQAVAQEGAWYAGDLGSFYEQNMALLSRSAVAPEPPAPTYGGRQANSFPDAPAIAPLPKDGTKGHLLEREALSYGLSSVRYPSGAFVVADDAGRTMNFKWGRSPIASGVSLSICSYKEATRQLLQRVDVPVPAGRVFGIDDVDMALQYADRIGYPVVCKPVAGLRGIGVVADIRSREELVRALELYTHSELGSDDFVIEQHVPGEDYRIVVINGKVVAAVLRMPASVTGDGVHTIADLIEYKNRARQDNPHLSSRPITFSEAMTYQLARHGMTLGFVPADGQHVLLANSANLSQGGDSVEVVDELHPTIEETAIRAVEAVPGLGFCGLDMLLEDHRAPVDEQQATVIELNAHAAIGSAQYPMWGTPTPVANTFFTASAQAYGIELPAEPAQQLTLHLRVRGRVGGVGYLRWLRRRAERLGVEGTITRHNARRVSVMMQGPTDAVSALVYLASKGAGRAKPTSVIVSHRPPFQTRGVRITVGRADVKRLVSRRLRRVRRRLQRVRRQLRTAADSSGSLAQRS